MARVLPTPAGARLELGADEAEVLRRIILGLVRRLEGGGDDPVVARLAPQASRGDAEADHELRRLLRDDLVTGRSQRLAALAEDLAGWAAAGGVDRILAADAAMSLLEGLNDVRIALGATIGIEALDRASLAADDPRFMTLGLIDHLGALQAGLVAVLDR